MTKSSERKTEHEARVPASVAEVSPGPGCPGALGANPCCRRTGLLAGPSHRPSLPAREPEPGCERAGPCLSGPDGESVQAGLRIYTGPLGVNNNVLYT